MPLAKSTSRQRPVLRLALKRHLVGKDRTLAGPGVRICRARDVQGSGDYVMLPGRRMPQEVGPSGTRASASLTTTKPNRS